MDTELRSRKDELTGIKDNLMAQLNQVIGRLIEIEELESKGYYLAKRKAKKNDKIPE